MSEAMRAFPIHNDADLECAIALIESLWDAEAGSPEGDLLEVMSTLVDVYEAQQSALPPGTPVELIRFKLKELDWTQRELGRRLGWGSGRVSEVLSGKRGLTLKMVQQISAVMEIPAGLLVHDVKEGAHGTPAGSDGSTNARGQDKPSFTANLEGTTGSVASAKAPPTLQVLQGGLGGNA